MSKDKTTATVVEIDDEQPGLEFLKNGRVRLNDEGTLYTLRMPRFGEFRAIKTRVFDATAAITERYKGIGDGKDVDTTDAAAVAAYVDGADQLVEITFEEMSKVIMYIFNGDEYQKGLSDRPLPEDTGAWPSWLIADRSIVQQFLTHWRTVPLGRGSS